MRYLKHDTAPAVSGKKDRKETEIGERLAGHFIRALMSCVELEPSLKFMVICEIYPKNRRMKEGRKEGRKE